MVTLFASLLRLFLQVFRSKRTIVSEIALVRKENEILLRRLGMKRVAFGFYDKLFLVVLNRAADIKHRLTLAKPETVLRVVKKRSAGQFPANWQESDRGNPRGVHRILRQSATASRNSATASEPS